MEVNQKQLAALLGISSRQVRNLKEQGLFEFVTDSRKYNAEKCVQEYIDFKIKAEVGNGTNLQKEKEYVVLFTGTKINYAVVKVTFESELVQEKSRPSK